MSTMTAPATGPAGPSLAAATADAAIDAGAQRLLIVNADDFGFTPGVNAGIVRAFEQGIVRSTSLMVCYPAAAEAVAYAKANPGLGVGLHIDLWESVPQGWSWRKLYERCANEEAAVEAEVRRQLDLFRQMMGREPDHLDTHQHIHQREPVRTVVERIAREVGLPLRGHGAVRYVGGFYGQDGTGGPYPDGISVARLLELIDALQPGITEFGCHPGDVEDDDPLGGTMYRVERNLEVQALCDPRVRERLARGDVRLVRFGDLAAERTA
jgi:predicted glycoside hydrolase/deacetylase ChbG (UPF0249 family)